MRIAFGVILVTGVCGGYVLALPVLRHHVIAKDLDQMHNSYVAIANGRADDTNRLDVISQVQRVYLDKLRHHNQVQNVVQQPQTQQTYLVVKTLRQRNKRYVSYLTLCHFKICNMGRKRTTRYFHMARRLDDNDS